MIGRTAGQCAAAALWGAAAAGPATEPAKPAPDTEPRLVFRVTGGGGKPIPAHISLRPSGPGGESGEPAASIQTDASGVASLPPLGAGLWSLSASADAHLTREIRELALTGSAQHVAVRLLHGAPMKGRVTSTGATAGAGGAPVPGAKVCLSWPPAEPGAAPDEPVCANSGEKGEVSWPLVPDGKLTARINADGLLPLEATVDAASRQPVWTLKPGAKVSGAVTDSNGQPLAGAPVTAADLLRQTGKDDKPPSAVTGEDGRFTVSGLSPGRWRIVIEPADAESVSRELDVRSGSTNDIGALRARPGLPLSGTVSGPDGEPVSGARVQSWTADRRFRRILRTATSGKDGEFRLGGMPAAPVDLIVRPPDGYAPTVERGLEAPRRDLLISLETAGHVSGQVRIEVAAARRGPAPVVTLSARTDTGLTGIAPIEVHARPSDPETGEFLLENVAPGTAVVVEASAAGLWSEPQTISVPAGGDGGPLEFRLQKGVAVEGSVLGTDGRTLAGARVHAGSGRGVESDASGEFRLEGLRPGTQMVIAEAAGYAPSSQNIEVPLPEGERMRFELSAGGSISGTVTDYAGAPVSGVRIHGMRSDEGLGEDVSAVTDLSGQYRFEHVEAGRWEIQRQSGASGSGGESRQVDVTEGRASVADFRVGRTLIGRLTRGGAPVAGAYVSIAQPSDWDKGTDDWANESTWSDAAGGFRLSVSGTGWATLLVVDGTHEMTKLIPVPSGAEPQVDVPLPDRLVSGRCVSRADQSPIASAQVSAALHSPTDAPHAGWSMSASTVDDLGQGEEFHLSARSRSSATSGPDGSFSLWAERGGDASLQAWATRYLSETVAVPETDTAPVEIALSPASSVRVLLFDSAGRPVRNAHVRLSMQVAGGTSTSESRTNDNKCDFSLEAGSWSLLAEAPGYAAEQKTGEIRATDSAEAREIRLTLAPGAPLRIRLTNDPEGKGKVVSMLDPQGVERVALADQGRVETASGDQIWETWGLAPGEWTIVVDPGTGTPLRRKAKMAPGPVIELRVP